MTNRDRDSLAELLGAVAKRLSESPDAMHARAETSADEMALSSGSVRRAFVDAFVNSQLSAEMAAASIAITEYIKEFLAPKVRKTRPRMRR